MLVVLPLCSKDAKLQIKNLEWCLELDSGCNRDGVLSYDTLTPKEDVAALDALARRYFKAVHHCCYGEPPVKGWPAAPNWAWQSTARWMFDQPFHQPWLWLEADACPLKSGWVQTLEAAFTAGNKRFGGHVVKDMGHMNGVGIYPWDVMRFNEMAMLTRAAAWDVVLKPSTIQDCVPLNHLIQHAWNVHPIDRAMIWNGEGQPVSFKTQADVDLYLDFNAIIMHRIKDGSLIPLLMERYQAEQKRVEEETQLIQSTDYNVPQHISRDDVAGISELVEPEGNSGRSINPDQTPLQDNGGKKSVAKTHILIVTYWKDRPWLEYCLKALKKFCTGFTGITVAIPTKDFGAFASLKADYGVTIRTYEEVKGKGMVQHMAMMARADELVPEGTEFVCHLDADCIYHTPTTPADYFTDGKPDYLVRTWESLTDPASKVVSDCAQWFTPTAKQLGFDPPIYGMCRHPTVLPIGFYKPYREHIAKVQGMPFMDYMVAGKNEFPQDRQDWTAMGAWAFQTRRDQFHWIDIGATGAVVPKDRQRTYWSHGGIKPEIKKEIEGFLA